MCMHKTYPFHHFVCFSADLRPVRAPTNICDSAVRACACRPSLVATTLWGDGAAATGAEGAAAAAKESVGDHRSRRADGADTAAVQHQAAVHPLAAERQSGLAAAIFGGTLRS